MKAKEYAESLVKADKIYQEKLDRNFENMKELLYEFYLIHVKKCVIDLLSESEEIAKVRHAKFDHAFHAILIEQNRKWKAIYRIYNETADVMFSLEENYFMSIVDMPEMFKELFDKYGR